MKTRLLSLLVAAFFVLFLGFSISAQPIGAARPFVSEPIFETVSDVETASENALPDTRKKSISALAAAAESMPPPDCSSAQTLVCGVPIVSSTAGAANNFVLNDLCGSGFEYGAEDRIYKFTVTERKGLHFVLTMAANIDLDLIIMKYCVPDSCVASTIEENTVTGIYKEVVDAVFDPGTFYVIVDGWEPQWAGAFTLTMNCDCACVEPAQSKPNGYKIHWDNFEDYDASIGVSPQSQRWRKWATNSIDAPVQELNGNSFLQVNAGSDVVYNMGKKTSNKYRASWRMKIPTGKTAYYSVLFDPPWASTGARWAYEVYFNGDGTGQLRVLSVSQQILYTRAFTYPQGTWFNVAQLVDLDITDGTTPNTELYVADEFVLAWEYGSSATVAPALTAINFFGIAGADFAVDEICVFQRNPNCVAPAVYAPVCGKNGKEIQNSGQAQCQLYSSLEWFDCFNACDVGGTFIYRGDIFSGEFTASDFSFTPPDIIYVCDDTPTYVTFNTGIGLNNAATPYYMDVYVFHRDPDDGTKEVGVNFINKSSTLIRDYLITCQRPDCGYELSGDCLDFNDPTTLPCNELYYIVIIGPLGSTYDFTVVPNGPCALNPPALAVGSNSGTVAGGPSNFSKTSGHYSQCYAGSRTFSGSEKTYRFQLDQPQKVRLTLSSQNEMGLFLFSYMCGQDCMGFSENIGAAQNGVIEISLPSGFYYVAVDKNAGPNNSFTLNFEKLQPLPPNTDIFLVVQSTGGGGGGSTCPTSPALVHEVVIEPKAYPFSASDQIQFLYRNTDGDLTSNEGLFKNWSGGTTSSVKFDLFGDVPTDSKKCSFAPGDSFFVHLTTIKNGRLTRLQIKPRFKPLNPPGITGTHVFQAGKISVIDSFIVEGSFETFQPSVFELNDIPSSAGSSFIQFSSSLPFLASEPANWLSLATNGAPLNAGTVIDGAATIQVNVTENPDQIPRTSKIRFESVDQPDLYWLNIGVLQKAKCTANPTVSVAASVPSATVCAGGSLELSATVAAGMANFLTYKWSTGATTQTIQVAPTAPTTYTVSITNPFCTEFNTNSASKSVAIVQPPTAQIAVPAQISCANSSVILNGSGSSSGATIAYQWSGPSGPISGATQNSLTVSQAGNYALVVSNTAAAGCSATATTAVSNDQNVPTALVAAPATITCLQTTVALNGGGSSSGTYFWTASGGGAISGATNQITATATKSGTYTLRVTAANGCTAEKSVQVIENKTQPTASAGGDRTLTCSTTNVVLDGSGSSAGAVFSWTGPSFSSALQSPTVSTAGTFTLTATDPTSGCTATDAVVVTANNAPPTVSAGNDKSLSCAQSSVVLDGSAGPSGQSFGFFWTGPNGFSSTQASPTVSTAGPYSLVVTNAATGCTASDGVQVMGDVAVPQAVASASGTLTCSTTSVTLSSAGSSAGAVAWTNPSGSVFSSSATVQVSAGGLYVLKITNPTNGCTAISTVEVNVNTTAPTASAGPQKMLTCAATTVVLDGSGSSSGPNFSYLWTNASGFSSPQQSPTVSAQGLFTLKVTDSSNGCTATATVLVTSNTTAPVAAASGPHSLTCAQTSVTLSSAGSSSGAGFENQWLAPGGAVISSSPTVVVSQTGLFTLVVTNTANGCSATATSQVNGGTNLPTASASVGAPISCQNPFSQLSSAGSTGTPSWTGPNGFSSNLPNPSVSQSGTYTLLVVLPASGCSATASVAVLGNATAPTVSILVPEKLTCTRLEVALTANATSPNGSVFQYAWTGAGLSGSTGQMTATATAAGLFQVLVTDPTNGCAKTATVAVEKDVAQPTGVSAGLDKTLFCVPPTVQLDGAGPSGFVFLWTGAGNISDPTALAPTVDAAGNYLLTVTNPANGCSKTDEVEVFANNSAPTATIQTPPNLLCQPPTVTLVGGPSSAVFEYQWIGPGALPPLNQSSVAVALGGQYTLLVTNKTNGCQDSETVFVTENNAPPTAIAGPTKTITCANNKTVVLEGSHQPSGLAANFAWTGPGGPFSGPMPTVNQVGQYILTVSLAQNGCSATSTAIVEIDTTGPTATAGFDQAKCQGVGQPVFSVGGGNLPNNIYSWSPASIFDNPTAANPTATLAAPGATTVSVTATNPANQCKKTDQAVLNLFPGVSVTVSVVSPSTPTASDGSLSAIVGGGTGPFSFQWFLNGQPLAGQTGPKLENQPSQNGYSILVTDANGCSAEASGFSTTVGLDEKSWSARLSVFPNPTADRVAVVLENAPVGPLDISLFDAVGRLVFAEKRQVNGSVEKWEIDFSSQPTGVFWLRLKSRDGAAERKILVVR